jgi:phage/plasmid primase-like uncharacterized protein
MLDTTAIAYARAVPIERVAAGLRLKRRGHELYGPCPVCGGNDRFWINTRKQIFGCRGCHVCGDVIALVRHIHGLSFIEAIEYLAGGNTLRRTVQSPPHNKPKLDDDNLPRAAAIWHASAPIAGTLGADYMAARGIFLDRVPDHGGLRFHAHAPVLDGVTPCVLARFTDIHTCAPRGIWRRPIEGGKPISLGPTSGAVIRLWPDDMVTTGLVIGEGVETVLAAATRIEHRGTLFQPAWAAASAGTMANFPVLTSIDALTILADNDAPDRNGRRAGQEAAARCASRWAAAGREVTILTPDDLGADFNDVVRP